MSTERNSLAWGQMGQGCHCRHQAGALAAASESTLCFHLLLLPPRLSARPLSIYLPEVQPQRLLSPGFEWLSVV